MHGGERQVAVEIFPRPHFDALRAERDALRERLRPQTSHRLRRIGLKAHAAFQLSDKPDRAAPLLTLRRIIVPQWTGAELLHAIKEDF